jgi:hypothetical protein
VREARNNPPANQRDQHQQCRYSDAIAEFRCVGNAERVKMDERVSAALNTTEPVVTWPLSPNATGQYCTT